MCNVHASSRGHECRHTPAFTTVLTCVEFRECSSCECKRRTSRCFESSFVVACAQCLSGEWIPVCKAIMIVDAELHASNLEEALKHSQDELDCAKRNRVALNDRILGQAAEIQRLQQSLTTAQEQVRNVHSMCNTAYCNHVRSIVGRIEHALLPAQSLVEILRPLQGNQLQSTGSESVDIDLKALLESKEWSSQDWERVEDASVHWLDRLHTILSSCASSVQVMTKNQHKRQEVEQTAASTLARQAETACSHLHEIHQQQVISMREAAEAAQHVAHVEQELQERCKEAADATAAREALEQEQLETMRNLHVAELRAREAETSCCQLRSQLQCLATEKLVAAADQQNECTVTHGESADSGVAEVSVPYQAIKGDSVLNTTAVNITGSHEGEIPLLPAAIAALGIVKKDHFEQSSEVSISAEQAVVQPADVRFDNAGDLVESQNDESGMQSASDEDKMQGTLSRTQSLEEEARSLHETAKLHALTEESSMTAVQTALRRLKIAAENVQKQCTSVAGDADMATGTVLENGGRGDGAAVGSVEERIGEVTRATAICSAALQRAVDARQAHQAAVAGAHVVERAALTANASDFSLKRSKVADAVCAEKQEMLDRLVSTEGALESREAMLLDLQMRLGHAEEQCQQHKAAACSSSALSDTTQKLLLVAEARAAEAENRIARYREKAAKSSKAMLLAHIRADDAEQALETEDDVDSTQDETPSATEGILTHHNLSSGTAPGAPQHGNSSVEKVCVVSCMVIDQLLFQCLLWSADPALCRCNSCYACSEKWRGFRCRHQECNRHNARFCTCKKCYPHT